MHLTVGETGKYLPNSLGKCPPARLRWTVVRYITVTKAIQEGLSGTWRRFYSLMLYVNILLESGSMHANFFQFDRQK